MKSPMSSIRSKFIVVVVIIFSILMILSLFLFEMIGRLAAYPPYIIAHPLQVSNAAFYANIEMMRIQKELDHLILTDDDHEIYLAEEDIKASEAKIYASMEIIGNEILGDEGKQLYEEARMLLDDWQPIRSEVIQTVKNGNKDEALLIYHSIGEAHGELLERKLVELNQYARTKANEFQDEVISLEENTKRISLVGIVTLAFVVVLSIVWVSLNVLSEIQNLGNQLENILKSDALKKVQLSGNDEFVQLGDIFNELITSLNRQLWIKEGNQKLYGIFGNSQKSQNVMNDYVQELVHYAGFISAAFYEGNGNELILNGVENRVSFMRDSYLYGEGYVGECAERKVEKTIDYNDTYNKSSGDIPIGSIIVKPILNDLELLGVLVLISSDKISMKETEYVANGIKDLSFFLEGQCQNRKIDQLLKKSTKANRELTDRQQALEEHQETLSRVNSELESQRDLLNLKSEELSIQNEELVELREELESKYDDLEESSKYRAQFFANVSHELRTPLNSIMILSDLLIAKDILDFKEEDVEKVAVINRAAKDLLIIINDILDLARIESGKIELDNGIFFGSQLMESLRVIFEPMMKEKSLSGEFYSDREYTFFGDEGKVYHIVSNFISNAMKFTKKGSIIVSVKRDHDHAFPIRIDVKDTGIGIRESKMEAIFDEFVQSDGSINRKFGGTGLGLAISRNYAELIGAVIEVESEFGYGSMFSLMLPGSYLVKNGKKIIPSVNKSYVMEEITTDLAASIQGKKVLICDDEPFNVFALSSLLENIGMETFTALNHEEAMSVYEENKVDIIMMDLMMPKVDGLTILSNMKSLPTWKEIPVVIITAANLTVQQSCRIEQEGYVMLRKPIVNNEVIKLLNELLG